MCVSWAGPRGVGFGSFSKCFRYVLSIVTPRYRRWQPILVSLRCFEDRPPEDVSLCEVLRCMKGSCGRCTFVMCCLVVSGLPFWPSSGSGDLFLLDMVVAPSGRVWDAWVTCDWGLGGVFGARSDVRLGSWRSVRCSTEHDPLLRGVRGGTRSSSHLHRLQCVEDVIRLSKLEQRTCLPRASRIGGTVRSGWSHVAATPPLLEI